MASTYYQSPYDDLAAEEEQLVVEKDDYTTRLPIQARKSCSLLHWLVRLTLVLSIAINVYLVVRARTFRVETHQMFCRCCPPKGNS